MKLKNKTYKSVVSMLMDTARSKQERKLAKAVAKQLSFRKAVREAAIDICDLSTERILNQRIVEEAIIDRVLPILQEKFK